MAAGGGPEHQFSFHYPSNATSISAKPSNGRLTLGMAGNILTDALLLLFSPLAPIDLANK